MLRPLRRYACVACLVGCSGNSDPETAPGTSDGSADSGTVPVTTGATGSTAAATSTGPEGGSTGTSDGSGELPTSASTGGEGTSSGDTGATGTTGPVGPVGSAGCGLLAPESGALEIEVQGQMGQYIVSLPPGYDPLTPYPLGFAFHGRNRTGPNCQDGDCAGFQSAMQDAAILVYMTALGGTGWEGDGEREINVEFFTKVLDDLLVDACIDESRVFVAGTSSGAHFVNILGCRFGDRLLAIAPVAGVLPETDGCVDSVAALLIHGFKDPHVPLAAGEEAREFWRTRNGCSDTTQPSIAEVHAAAEAVPESHSCAVFQGCEADLPVVWCEHSEGGYDDSTHGWPLFGGQQIWEFVQSLP
jgi:polyhydroxybutyrate depolymerase